MTDLPGPRTVPRPRRELNPMIMSPEFGGYSTGGQHEHTRRPSDVEPVEAYVFGWVCPIVVPLLELLPSQTVHAKLAVSLFFCHFFRTATQHFSLIATAHSPQCSEIAFALAPTRTVISHYISAGFFSMHAGPIFQLLLTFLWL